MALREDDVLSLVDSDHEGSASDFSGFGPNEILTKKGDDVTVTKTSNAASNMTKKSDVVTSEKNKKGPGKANPHSASKKGKNKAPSQKHEKDKSKKKKSSSLDIDNLSHEEITQLREILGFNNREIDGPSVFDLFGDDPANLHIECQNDGPDSDVEVIPSAPLRSLDVQLKEALFADESESKENESIPEDISWQLPKLKAPRKGQAVSPSLASLINTACTSQCEVDDIISRYKLPSNCEKMTAPTVNPEVWTEIARKAQTYDKAFQDIQTLIATGMVPIIKLVNVLKSHMTEEAKSMISDSITLLGQAQYNISLRRRYMIRPHLKKKYAALCNIATPISSMLFGDDLNKEIKKCDTSISVAKEHYGQFGNYRGHYRGRARGRGVPYRGYGSANQGYGNQYAGRGYNRFHPYYRHQPNFRQVQAYTQIQGPKKGTKSATATSQGDNVV
ncbi:MAG: DUF5320 domain-containing protein [Candidatus Thiodiazotropha taylori]|nr:DUF5320 domain-containing protein [Candidatus Thiodiazotropha taylori]